MRRTLGIVLASFALVAAACSNGGQTESATPPAEEPTSSTTSTTSTAPDASTTVVETTTTTAAPTPTPPPTTAPPPAQAFTGPVPKAVLTATGITAPVVGQEGEALLVGTPCGNTSPIRSGTPVDGVVVLDAGHGGVEPGAVGPNGLSERELNLAVTGFVRQHLEANKVGVVLTRNEQYRITIDARAKIVSAIKPKAFVSIHFNAEPDGPRDGPGTETYYQTKGSTAAGSKRLSGLIYEETVRALSQYSGIAWVADRDAGTKYRTSSTGNDYYGILRTTQGTPASLAELGFISNPPEAELYARADVQKVLGEAVGNGILRFLRTKDPGSGFVEPYPREQPAGGGGGKSNCTDPPLG